MDSDKRKALEGELSKLTILQLRDLARKHSMDLSGSIRKKELIDRILDSGLQIDEAEIHALSKKPSEHIPIEESGHAAAESKQEPLTEQRIAEIREHLRQILAQKPSFFSIDGELEAAVVKYNAGDYYGAIQALKLAREKASDAYGRFRVYTNAMGINASEQVLNEAVKRQAIAADRSSSLIQSAMGGFVDGTPEKREQTLNKLETEAIGAMDKITGSIGLEIQMKHNRANELKEIGANVAEAFTLLTEADRAKQALHLEKAKELISKADVVIKAAEKVRVEEIKFWIPRVRSSIDDAKLVGLDVKEQEETLQKASYAFEQNQFKKCVDDLKATSVSIDNLLNVKLASDPVLRQSKLDEARRIAAGLNPAFDEAVSLGVDVSEAYHYISNMGIAINRQDALNAMKFVRKAEALSREYDSHVKALKEKAVHLNDVRCPRCNMDMVNDFPNGIRRCSNCSLIIKR